MKLDAFKKNLKAIARDILVSMMVGVGISLVIIILSSLIAGIVSGFELSVMLNAIRSCLLIAGALFLFVVAGLILGQKSNRKIGESEKWKATIHILNPVVVLGIVAVIVLGIATVVDYIVWLS